ncbi:hypothetical protein PTKIN_Ptkin08bG0075000 [Pterospermum kingtungense]
MVIIRSCRCLGCNRGGFGKQRSRGRGGMVGEGCGMGVKASLGAVWVFHNCLSLQLHGEFRNLNVHRPSKRIGAGWSFYCQCGDTGSC